MTAIAIIGGIILVPLAWEMYYYRKINKKATELQNKLDVKIQCNNCRTYYPETEMHEWEFCNKCFDLLVNKKTNQGRIK
tara:strand:- start:406 stop:642 length:237 start_codon:yes stop_codon:yes gene_type:complete